MSQHHKLTVNSLAAQANLQIQLQLLLDILKASLAGLEQVDSKIYDDFTQFFTLDIASNKKLDHAAAIREAKRWLLSGAFREAIEITNIFLDECWMIFSFYKLYPKGVIQVADKDRVLDSKKSFHKLPLNQKLSKLSTTFGINIELEKHILSINAVRNCLVHRLGTVGKKDIEIDGAALTVYWRSPDILVHFPSGTEQIVDISGQCFERGTGLGVVIGDQEKSFVEGQQVEFTHREITRTFSTIFAFSTSVMNSINQYGISTGIIKNLSQELDSTAK